MVVFLEILKLQLKTSFQYRGSFLLSLLLNPVMLILFISVLQTIYDGDSQKLILGYSLSQMIWYFAAIRFFYSLVWSYPDREISEEVLSGGMVLRLLKPISLLKWEFAKALANKFSSFLFEFIPSLLIYFIMVFPSFMTPESLLKYLLLSVTGFVMFFLIGFLIGTTAFLLHNTEAMQSIKFILINFAAGASIPIEFYPASLQDFVLSMPFKYLFYVPVQFLLNKPEVSGLNYFLIEWSVQLSWTLAFYILCRIFVNLMIRKYNSVGG